MADRFIPDVLSVENDRDKPASTVSVQRAIIELAEMIHKIEGRIGDVSILDDVNVDGSLTATSLESSGSIELADSLDFNERALDPDGTTAPNLSSSGTGRIYFDRTTDKFRVSESGGAYVNLIGTNATAAIVTNTSTQSITTGGADKVLAFTSESYDDSSYHDNAVNNSRLTITSAGVYEVSVNVVWDTNATGSRFLGIRKNGTTTWYVSNLADGTNGNYQSITVTRLLAASDYLEAVVFQDSGGTRTISANPFFSIFLVKTT